MIKFQTTPTPITASGDMSNFGKEQGLSAKEAARIFLKLGPTATSDEVRKEAALYALRTKTK